MAVQRITNLTPSGAVSIDATNSWTITGQVGSEIDAYQVVIQNNANLTTLYDSGKVTLTDNLFRGDTLTITIPANSDPNNSITNDLKIRYVVTAFLSTNQTNSRTEALFTRTTPTFVIDAIGTVTSQIHTLTATYTQTEGVALDSYQFIVTDSNNVEVFNSNTRYGQNARYQISGLVNGESYTVNASGQTELGVSLTATPVNFSVSYSPPSVSTKPTATQDRRNGNITVDFGNVVNLTGTSTGTINYISDFNYTGNLGLQITDLATTTFTLNVPETFTAHWVARVDAIPPSVRNIARLQSSAGAEYTLRYDGTRFIYNINGNENVTLPISLTVNDLLIITLLSNRVVIRKV